MDYIKIPENIHVVFDKWIKEKNITNPEEIKILKEAYSFGMTIESKFRNYLLLKYG